MGRRNSFHVCSFLSELNKKKIDTALSFARQNIPYTEVACFISIHKQKVFFCDSTILSNTMMYHNNYYITVDSICS